MNGTQETRMGNVGVPEGTEFCPLLHGKCVKNGNIDKNCFSSKAAGCLEGRLYVQNREPGAHVTQEYAQDYFEKHF